MKTRRLVATFPLSGDHTLPLVAHCPSCGTPTRRYHLCDNCCAIGATAPQLFTTNNPSLEPASSQPRERN